MSVTGSALVALNRLQRSEAGVFIAADVEQPAFNYSDGESSERMLQDILQECDDLSSDSAELQARIVDWPSEYHLSDTRANLLRALDLTGCKKVLELGCGCGSISRYLGEQDNLAVDAVEGSPVRAGLAALRCRDLPNVTISSGNFNELELPEAHYDLVLFVGVTEYAGRFSAQPTDEQALQELLASAKKALAPNGMVLIAIENRLGLKYLLGASEDHYGIPNVGLQDYPDSSGIRTYSKSQWQQQIDAAGFSAQQFAYPFPDYKVPSVMLRHGEHSSNEAVRAIAGTRSRDYLRHFDLGDQEAEMWQALAEADTLDAHANSFLIGLGDAPETLARLFDFKVASWPAVAHDWHAQASQENSATTPESISADARLLRMRGELLALQTHALELEKRVQTVTGSRGWRLLQRLRSLFGR